MSETEKSIYKFVQTDEGGKVISVIDTTDPESMEGKENVYLASDNVDASKPLEVNKLTGVITEKVPEPEPLREPPPDAPIDGGK